MPFAMDPLVYDFQINDRGTWGELLTGEAASMPDGYYSIVAPKWLKREMRELSEQNQFELSRLSRRLRSGESKSGWLLDRLLPQAAKGSETSASLRQLLQANGSIASSTNRYGAIF